MIHYIPNKIPYYLWLQSDENGKKKKVRSEQCLLGTVLQKKRKLFKLKFS